MQTGLFLNGVGIATYIIPGVSALAALVAVVAVIINGWLERRRTFRQENPDLLIMGPRSTEILGMMDQVSIHVSLANNGTRMCTVSNVYLEIPAPIKRKIVFSRIDWLSVHPALEFTGGNTMGLKRKLPFPVFPSGMTRVDASYKMSDQTLAERQVVTVGELVVVYSMGGYQPKELRLKWGINLAPKK